MIKMFARTAFAAAALAAASLGAAAAPVAPVAAPAVLRGAPQGMVENVQYYRDRCSPRQALRKAWRMGLNRPAVVRDNRRAVVVDGRQRGRLVTVRFANVRGCPVINVR